MGYITFSIDGESEELPLNAGFVVGLVPQIRKLLIGDSAPVHVIQDTALLLGGGAIPAVTLIMRGNLLRGLQVQGSVILGMIIIRYVALPLLGIGIGIGIVKGAIHFGLVHHNPLYEFVLCFSLHFHQQ
ncbi:unnamed protein product [Fraxinus pennsylvanica]|uniref:Uncharacterized protein n=1 Tax=Fraxinus pennsylvanica TaxID=56036 RepID=A0AAD2A020_9LAMI|nr:unnamed protein product [Fraxinus pennsylvanica]